MFKFYHFYLHCCTWLHFLKSWVIFCAFFYSWEIFAFVKNSHFSKKHDGEKHAPPHTKSEKSLISSIFLFFSARDSVAKRNKNSKLPKKLHRRSKRIKLRAFACAWRLLLKEKREIFFQSAEKKFPHSMRCTYEIFI